MASLVDCSNTVASSSSYSLQSLAESQWQKEAPPVDVTGSCFGHYCACGIQIIGQCIDLNCFHIESLQQEGRRQGKLRIFPSRFQARSVSPKANAGGEPLRVHPANCDVRRVSVSNLR